MNEAMMIKWIRVEAGDYWSDDDRFHIIKTYDRLYGNHWHLMDHMKGAEFRGDSLKQCKSVASEWFVKGVTK